jgi:hypothetical protein
MGYISTAEQQATKIATVKSEKLAITAIIKVNNDAEPNNSEEQAAPVTMNAEEMAATTNFAEEMAITITSATNNKFEEQSASASMNAEEQPVTITETTKNI